MDDPSTYVQFHTSGDVFVGYSSFLLPGNISPSRAHISVLHVNFNGPAYSTQPWRWSIYDWNQQRWINLGDNKRSQAGKWNHLIFRIPNLARYVSPSREIRIQLSSGNSTGDAKIDYAAIHLVYHSMTPIQTRSMHATVPDKTRSAFLQK